MRRSTEIEQAAIEAVARHFSTTLQEGRGSAEAVLTVAGTRIALLVTLVGLHAGRRAEVTKPRLRFDRVARSLLARLDPGERTTGRRCLVIASKDGPVPIEACRQVCSQLGVSNVFEQTLVATPEGHVATLSA